MPTLIYTSTKYKPKRKSRKPVGDVAKKLEKKPFVTKKPTPEREKRAIELAPSLQTETPFQMPVYPKYEGEMAEREAAAQVELEKKKKRVGILVNKSAYQYLGDAPPEIMYSLGKK